MMTDNYVSTILREYWLFIGMIRVSIMKCQSTSLLARVFHLGCTGVLDAEPKVTGFKEVFDFLKETNLSDIKKESQLMELCGISIDSEDNNPNVVISCYLSPHKKILNIHIDNRKFFNVHSVDIWFDKNKVKKYHFDWLYTKEDAPRYVGVKTMVNAIRACKKYGIPWMDLGASKTKDSFTGKGDIGYIVWPKIGFDGVFSEAERHQLPQKYQKARSVQELFSMNGGIDWWKRKGWGREMFFDLNSESQNEQMEQFVSSRSLNDS